MYSCKIESSNIYKIEKTPPSRLGLFMDKDGTYDAGELVSGHVILEINTEVRVKSISLVLSGYARVSWDEEQAVVYFKFSRPKGSHKNTEIIFNQTLVLLKKGEGRNRPSIACGKSGRMSLCFPISAEAEDGGIQLQPGTHKYPFEFQLPSWIPGSYEGKWGQISYTAKAVVERPWRTDIETNKPFTIKSVVDFNEDPDVLRPIAGRSRVLVASSCWCCMGGGDVVVDVKLERKGYIIGDSVTFTVEVINETTLTMQESEVALVQHVVFNAAGRSKKITSVVAGIKRGPVARNQTKLWENEQLQIPADVPPTNRECNAIQTKYTLSVILTPSDTWYEVVTVPVTIEIGTVAPSKTTISRFLNMIAEGRSGSRSSSSVGRMTVAEMQALRARRLSSMASLDNQSEVAAGGLPVPLPGRVRRVSSGESSQAESTKSGIRKKKSGGSTPERKISYSGSVSGSDNNAKSSNKHMDEIG